MSHSKGLSRLPVGDIRSSCPHLWLRRAPAISGRFASINDLPGVIVDGPEGPVQTAAFEIEGDVIRALYVVLNPDKLRLVPAASGTPEAGPG